MAKQSYTTTPCSGDQRHLLSHKPITTHEKFKMKIAEEGGALWRSTMWKIWSHIWQWRTREREGCQRQTGLQETVRPMREERWIAPENSSSKK